ncbi:hypothetical protein NN561_018092 [Cricetulus griseus]
MESLMFSHQPTWDDCQQLLEVLFTTEEKERILLEARKNVPGANGAPTNLPNEIDAGFPLNRPDWDFNTAAGRERLTVYRRALMAGLRGGARRPTNLAKDADKLTLGQQTTVVAPHALESIIRQPPDRWMINARVTHYQSLLLTERVTYAPPAVLNPATLLPETDNSSPIHHCADILVEETGIQNDQRDQPWPGSLNWYTDGNSFVVEGKRKAGAAVVDGKQVIWASSLPEGTSAQKAEPVALIQALQMAEGKSINIYTDSRVRNTPGKFKLTPYEILCDGPPPLTESDGS